jgi:hypothetical protein
MAEKAKRRSGDRHSAGYQAEYRKENYKFMGFYLRKDSGMIEGLQIVAKARKISVSEYIRCAVENQLALDGYIPGEPFIAEN